jgi:hypothetical protein
MKITEVKRLKGEYIWLYVKVGVEMLLNYYQLDKMATRSGRIELSNCLR